MRGRNRVRAQVTAACVLIAAIGGQLAFGAPVATAQLDAKRQEAAELQRKIAEQGRRLSLADEAFNQARIQRQRIEGQAGAARDMVAAAESRWEDLRVQLGQRARKLYMHPGAALDAWLGATSFSDLARAHKFGSEVLIADAELVTQTERARQEVLARARRLGQIRDAASQKESELASRRSEVSGAVSQQRALLAGVTGEIATLLEEQRQAELAAARAAEQQAAPPAEPTGASPPVIGDDRGTPATPKPTPEPEGPAPPVKSGAAKAVQTAVAQIGKPYEWAAEGPDSFDCSGLTLYAWRSAGVSLPHSSQMQYSSLPKVSRSQLRPGDLVFFGSPIHHVGIYEGGGVMINAPETGEYVRRNSINRADYAGAARP